MLLGLGIIQSIQMFTRRSQQICRSKQMRCVIVEVQVVIYDGEIGMISLQEMLECSRSAIRRRLNVINLDSRNIDGSSSEVRERVGDRYSRKLKHDQLLCIPGRELSHCC